MNRFCAVLFCFFIPIGFVLAEDVHKFKIEKVEYHRIGFTSEYALKSAVPINKTTIFNGISEFGVYITTLKTAFANIRTLEYTNIKPSYSEPDQDNLVKVTLVIETKDSWNIIALPYPKFDSNSGFLFKLKIKDYNFAGTMQELNADFDYHFDENGKNKFAFGTEFAFLFGAGPLDGKSTFNLEGNFPIDNKSEGMDFSIGSGVEFSYGIKFFEIIFGVNQSFNLNQEKGAPIGNNGFKYYMRNEAFVSTPFTIVSTKKFGKLKWIPRLLIGGNWSFTGPLDEKVKGADIEFKHSLTMGNVNWKHNFREGLDFSIANEYKYNTHNTKPSEIFFSGNVTGYLAFLNRVGIYAKAEGFYNLNNVKTERAGENLRGILNRRINTDTAFTLNLDLPIKVGRFDFEEITGESWTRFFGFELHIVPFLDMAITHDLKTGRYFHPADGWYAGGLEVIIYPIKMKSIYVRMSAGFDLTELKSGGVAKRDGEPVREIFIGLGLHY